MKKFPDMPDVAAAMESEIKSFGEKTIRKWCSSHQGEQLTQEILTVLFGLDRPRSAYAVRQGQRGAQDGVRRGHHGASEAQKKMEAAWTPPASGDTKALELLAIRAAKTAHLTDGQYQCENTDCLYMLRATQMWCLANGVGCGRWRTDNPENIYYKYSEEKVGSKSEAPAEEQDPPASPVEEQDPPAAAVEAPVEVQDPSASEDDAAADRVEE